MPREMLQNLVVSVATAGTRRTRYLIPVSAAAHVVAGLAAVVLPLYAQESLPGVNPAFTARPELPPIAVALPRQPRVVREHPPRSREHRPAERAAPVATGAWVAPVHVPDELTVEDALLEVGWGEPIEGGVPCSGEECAVAGLPGDGVAPVPAPSRPVRVGGHIEEPVKLRHVAPVYPEMARLTRVEGLVILECTISADGRVTNVRVLRGHPLLDQAAVDAVRQWVYSPTLLNARPVPVVMTVTVRFTLS